MKKYRCWIKYRHLQCTKVWHYLHVNLFTLSHYLHRRSSSGGLWLSWRWRGMRPEDNWRKSTGSTWRPGTRLLWPSAWSSKTTATNLFTTILITARTNTVTVNTVTSIQVRNTRWCAWLLGYWFRLNNMLHATISLIGFESWLWMPLTLKASTIIHNNQFSDNRFAQLWWFLIMWRKKYKGSPM